MTKKSDVSLDTRFSTNQAHFKNRSTELTPRSKINNRQSSIVNRSGSSGVALEMDRHEISVGQDGLFHAHRHPCQRVMGEQIADNV